MNIIKKISGTLTALIVMAVIAAAVILYQAGYYDFTFIPRNTSENKNNFDNNVTAQPEKEETFLTEGDNLKDVYDISDIEKEYSDNKTNDSKNSETKTSSISIPYTSTLASLGYSISRTGTYNSYNYKIGQIETLINFPKIINNEDGQNVLSVYMGYILYNDGANISALLSDGTVAVAGIEKLQRTYLRDAEGNPLFGYEGKYYRLVPGTNTMEEVQIDPLFAPSLIYDSVYKNISLNKVGLFRFYTIAEEERKIDSSGKDITESIDHKLSEAVKDNKDIEDPEVYAKLKIPDYTIEYRDCLRWGYTDSRGNVIIDAKYYYASDFDEYGYAVVAERYGVASIINKNGSVVVNLNSRILYPEDRNRRPIFENYYLPEQTVSPSDFGLDISSGYIGYYEGLSKIGMFSFDHGFIRMRYMRYDYKNETEVVRDEEVLIKADGTRFNIPADYKLIAYSDGILLLEKDGFYGYLDYTGKWIIQPIYTYAQPFMQGLAVLGFADGRKAIIDTEGNLVLPFNYTHISNASSGVITAFGEGRWYILNIMSKS